MSQMLKSSGAMAAATLQHPNLCPVFDVGQIDGVHYISMAYIEGRPLSTFIRSDKPVSARQAAAGASYGGHLANWLAVTTTRCGMS